MLLSLSYNKTAAAPAAASRFRGLSAEEVVRSRAEHGSNALQKQKRKSFFRKFISGFGDPVIRILLGALAINFLFFFRTFDLFETFGIVLAILLATLISALSERGGELAFDRLHEEMEKTSCIARRDGSLVRVPLEELVVGDFVLLEAGEKIPADGILLSGAVTVNQSALNGESREVEKRISLAEPQNWSLSDATQLFRGSTVCGGEGVMYICRVGGDTVYGSITDEMQMETRESPLKTRLTKLASQMSVIGYCAAALVALSYLFNIFVIDAGMLPAEILRRLRDTPFLLSELIHALTLATTVIVVAVPEGLPMMISVVLSANIRRMQRDRVLVRKPVGIETAGSMNLLFTDKTGTLTKGEPEVCGLLLGDGTLLESIPKLRKYKALYALYETSAVCNTASVISGGEAAGGNATDRAILKSVLPLAARTAAPEITDRVPFHSQRKYSSVRVGGTLFIKGAPEILLPQTRMMINPDGTVSALDACALRALTEKWRSFTARAMRVLAITAETEKGLALVGLVLIRDDLRPGAKKAISRLRRAGIQVVMMTGDNRDTASAIASEAGILKSGGVVLTSEELSRLSDDAVRSLLPRLCVVARAVPSDKSRMVRLAQDMKLTVGMTGDGINDAPALIAADVGFAMGSGTEVAKEAGDIVIVDDNIESIAKAVLYGRTIFKSIRKFIIFQLTTNLCAVGISVICPFFGIDSPVTVLQMLWVNMIMDTFGSLAFAGEAPLPEYMDEAPKAREANILNSYMAFSILTMGAYIIGLSLWFLQNDTFRDWYGFYNTPVVFYCAFFAFFIFAGIINCFCVRTTRLNPLSALSQNKPFLVIFSFISIVQLLMIYFGGSVFRTTPLTFPQLLLALLCAGTVAFISFFTKLLWKAGSRSRGGRKETV